MSVSISFNLIKFFYVILNNKPVRPQRAQWGRNVKVTFIHSSNKDEMYYSQARTDPLNKTERNTKILNIKTIKNKQHKNRFL